MEKQPRTINVNSLQDKIGWHPHPAQQQILDAYLAGKKKIVVACGQRFGKSQIASFICCIEALVNNKSILVVAPSYSLTDRIFEFLRLWLSTFFNKPVDFVSKPFPKIDFPNWGTYIEGKSEEAKEQILGKSYDLIIADESSRLSRDLFQNFLIPRLGEKKGSLLMIGTPWKKDHFYEAFLAAKEDNAAFQFPTSANPYYPKESIEAIQKQLPAAIFQREFLGTFTDELSSIFPNAIELINPLLPRAGHPGIFHYCGLDLAQSEDFSALVIIDESTGEVVFSEKWNQMPYPAQLSKIIGIVSRYRPCKVVIDSRNIGSVLSEELRASGIPVEDFVATGTISKDWEKRGSKEKLVEKTMALFEAHSISLPNDADLLDELSSFSYTISPMGNIRYSAPSGLHDDLVFALMLACWNLQLNPQKKKEQDYAIKRYNEEYDRNLKARQFYPEIGY